MFCVCKKTILQLSEKVKKEVDREETSTIPNFFATSPPVVPNNMLLESGIPPSSDPTDDTVTAWYVMHQYV